MASEYDSQKPRVSVETIPIGMMNVTDLAVARGPVTGDSGERLSPGPSPVLDLSDAGAETNASATGARGSRPSGRPPAPRMTPIEPHALRAATTPDDDVDGFLAPAAPSKALPIVGGLVLGLGILGGIAAYSRTRDPAPTVTPASATPATPIPAVSATPAGTAPPVAPAAATGTTAPAADATKGASATANPPANGKATPKATATTAAPVVTAATPATVTPPVPVPAKPKPKSKDEDDPWK